MKPGLFYIAMIFCLINNTYAMEQASRFTISGESMDNGSASAIGIYTGSDAFYGGLSFNHIRSSTVIQHSNRKTIYPLYLVLGLRTPWKLSPFIETGLDLPEAIYDEIVDSEDNAIDLTDYFISGGLNFSVNKQFSFSLYAKRYRFKFREDYLSPTIKKSVNSYGMGLTMRF